MNNANPGLHYHCGDWELYSFQPCASWRQLSHQKLCNSDWLFTQDRDSQQSLHSDCGLVFQSLTYHFYLLEATEQRTDLSLTSPDLLSSPSNNQPLSSPASPGPRWPEWGSSRACSPCPGCREERRFLFYIILILTRIIALSAVRLTFPTNWETLWG